MSIQTFDLSKKQWNDRYDLTGIKMAIDQY